MTLYFLSGVWGLEKPIVAIIARKHLIKSHIWKDWSVEHFGDISTDSECPAIKIFKTGLIHPYILP